MSEFQIKVEGSGKHCHVTKETLEKLFGIGFELEVKRMLSQPGQFSTPHRVTITGPKGSTTLSILGPCRSADQIELSMTDARALGIDAPIRESGDVKGTPGCKIAGPNGEMDLPEGVIIAKRHIHFTPEDAEKYGVEDQQIVKVKIGGERAVIFDEVVVRVSPDFATFMHIDYDEVNAASMSSANSIATLIV